VTLAVSRSAAPAPARLLERLCNVDFPVRPEGFATRTVIGQLACQLIERAEGEASRYGLRSSARSLLQALELVAAALARPMD
jgi:sarcosine oxidase gamma subunit